ncbi:transcription elongation factor A N-terminal and central domain-containing protein [Physeter macrocephalus]|uniref:Transcription elongation factor A N-terminal and central domain-containing protein n=1 Tax=Physeter macrocephalus TaxID=9755 RepID=A0A2Y9RY40_PHYMC|nr:transcription elongation factor A N-terminal and central domain-containing protein [Physeter catodon]XP_023971228.1 transcription elongation factor A N-terminal and central domain-containing protein [Physeter catodon]XP_023971229.1 transcription elongation factor A N-terminal and central domain-containing protein [Physeter catodon]|eukprot:XP_023971227.1 transcription elongation factor A N-terminal and central domain-containing protein [Physeter catodon]
MSDKQQIAARASLIEQLMSKRNFEDLGNHLTELETLRVSPEHLQETDVVRAVYRVLKNCPTAALKKKAKRLLSEWKALYKGTHCKPRGSPKLFPPGGNKEANQGLSPDPNQDEIRGSSCCHSLRASQDVAGAVERVVPENSPGGAEPKAARLRAADPQSPDERASEQPHPAAPLRAKCTELLYEALTSPSTEQPRADLWHNFAREIEEHIFTLHSKNLKKYKTCIRSKVANLKNPRKSHLQQSLLSGTMSPREFAEMTAMEMASPELKQLRASYTESGIQEHYLPQVVEGTPTKKIKCRRCEKFNCQVTVIARGTLFLPSWVQNSNPDEEMMTYVICNECGKQWYHSKWECL